VGGGNIGNSNELGPSARRSKKGEIGLGGRIVVSSIDMLQWKRSEGFYRLCDATIQRGKCVSNHTHVAIVGNKSHFVYDLLLIFSKPRTYYARSSNADSTIDSTQPGCILQLNIRIHPKVRRCCHAATPDLQLRSITTNYKSSTKYEPSKTTAGDEPCRFSALASALPLPSGRACIHLRVSALIAFFFSRQTHHQLLGASAMTNSNIRH
jgi:hypothetical protein